MRLIDGISRARDFADLPIGFIGRAGFRLHRPFTFAISQRLLYTFTPGEPLSDKMKKCSAMLKTFRHISHCPGACAQSKRMLARRGAISPIAFDNFTAARTARRGRRAGSLLPTMPTRCFFLGSPARRDFGPARHAQAFREASSAERWRLFKISGDANHSRC